MKQDITGAGIESEDVGVAEVTLAPRSRVAGKTLWKSQTPPTPCSGSWQAKS